MYKKIVVLITLILMLSFNFASLTTDLVSYYNFDETSGTTATDSLSANAGTITGATINQTGIIGKAYSFDGTGDYVTLANESNFDFMNSVTADATICFWYKQNGATVNYSRYFSKGTN